MPMLVSNLNLTDMSNFYPLEVVGRASETQLQWVKVETFNEAYR